MTETGPLCPVTVLELASVAVSVWLPAVVNVALKVPTPFVKLPAPGSEVDVPGLVLVKFTVPA